MTRIMFVISSLGGGGAERVAVRLIDRWVANGCHVDLVTIASPATDFYPVSPRTRRWVVDLPKDRRGLRAKVLDNRDRIRRLRAIAAEAEPDVVVSFMDQTNVLSLAALARTHVPVVVCEQIDPRQHDTPFPWRVLRVATYRRAAAIVVLTEAVRDWASGRFGSAPVVVIPNPGEVPATLPEPADLPTPYVVAVGRLVPQKGFDLLIDAFAGLDGRYASWHLVVAGEGPDREALEAQVAALGLGGRVHLIGRVHDVTSVLTGASLFVLSSRYEGFPVALLEAMGVGLPCVATRCPSGPEEIIRTGIDGVLVEPESSTTLRDAIASLIDAPEQRAALGPEARRTAESRFDLARVGGDWDALLASVAASR